MKNMIIGLSLILLAIPLVLLGSFAVGYLSSLLLVTILGGIILESIQIEPETLHVIFGLIAVASIFFKKGELTDGNNK